MRIKVILFHLIDILTTLDNYELNYMDIHPPGQSVTLSLNIHNTRILDSCKS